MAAVGRRHMEPLPEHLATLGSLAQVIPGYSAKPDERRKDGEYLLIGGRNIKDGRIVRTTQDSYVNELSKQSFTRAVAQPGDIIVSTLFSARKLCIYRETDPRGVLNSSCAIIRAPESNDYIVSYLRTLEGREDFLDKASQATGRAFIPRLSIRDLSAVQIPILPLDDLEKLGDDHIRASSTEDLGALLLELNGARAQMDQVFDGLAGSEYREQIETARDVYARASHYFEDRVARVQGQLTTNELKQRISHGETSQLEFKASLRMNLRTKQHDKAIENAVLKTIAAFCNTRGGELLIGVSDDHSIVGIEVDGFKTDDGFLLHLGHITSDRLVPAPVSCVDFDTVDIEGKRICRVECSISKEGVWLKEAPNLPEVFYIRSGPSSTPLGPRAATRYIVEHFHNKT